MADSLGVTVDHLVLVAADVRVTVAFYARVLGAEVRDLERWDTGEVEYPVLHFGTWKMNVHPRVTDAAPRAAHPVTGSVDLALRWPGDVASAQRHLEELGVPIILGPIGQVGATGDAESVYFRDPDGSLLELICYP